MRVAILSATRGWHTDELVEAISSLGHTGVVVSYQALEASLGRGAFDRRLDSESESLLDADAVLARIIPQGSLEQIIFRLNALHWLDARGVPVMNSPSAIERSVDKFLATALLDAAGLAVPDTFVCDTSESALRACGELGDVIFKPLFGSMGRGMVRVSDPDTACRVARAWEELRAVFYVQRAIAHEGRDIRVFIVGGRVVGAIERIAPPGDWRTNVARGGVARALDLPPEWGALAIRAAAAVGAAYAGVDLLPASNGEVYVLEVNGIPGWQALQAATGVRVAPVIVEHVCRMAAATTPAIPPVVPTVDSRRLTTPRRHR